MPKTQQNTHLNITQKFNLKSQLYAITLDELLSSKTDENILEQRHEKSAIILDKKRF